MPRRSGFHPRGQTRSSGVARTWALGPGGSTQQSITGSGVTIIGSGATPTVSELTILRTRGLLQFYLFSAANPGEGFTGAFGIMVVSDQAFAAGVVSMPSPVNELESNLWFYHQFLSIHAPDGGIGDGVAGA